MFKPKNVFSTLSSIKTPKFKLNLSHTIQLYSILLPCPQQNEGAFVKKDKIPLLFHFFFLCLQQHYQNQTSNKFLFPPRINSGKHGWISTLCCFSVRVKTMGETGGFILVFGRTQRQKGKNQEKENKYQSILISSSVFF